MLTANNRLHRGSLSCLGLLHHGRRFLWNQYVTNLFTLPLLPRRRSQTRYGLFVSDFLPQPDLGADAACAAAAANAGVNLVSLAPFLDGIV